MSIEVVSLKTVLLGSEIVDLGWLWTKAAHDVASKIWVVAGETFIQFILVVWILVYLNMPRVALGILSSLKSLKKS